MNEVKGMRIGGACFLLVTEPGIEGKYTWQGAGQFDWFVDSPLTGREALAKEKLGERRLHGMTCMVVLCDDERVRAVPMKALESAPKE